MQGISRSRPDPGGRLRIAIDIGGTFSDLAAFDEASGELRFGKALSTHEALVDGIQNTVAGAGVRLEDAHLFLHGSTIAINTLLERTGARTALLVTEGFRDIYEIGRVNRPDAYNLFFRKHVPLIERSSRYEVHERLRADGAVHKPLDEAHLRSVLRPLKARGIEAVAILLLHSYRTPDHEVRVKQIVQEELPDVFVSASHELSQEYREFERVSTVAANAYVGPKVSAYLGEISEYLDRQRFNGTFFVVQSTGGLFPVAHARRDCVRMLESGPAAGVIGTQAICRALGLTDAIAFDMGGTTAKAGVIYQGKPLTTGSALIGGYDQALPIQIPMTDIFEVGTGGGSIASLDRHGALRVGPRSAGSSPGPVCYGHGGTEPTVTDANLILGRLDADHFLGGEMQLDLEAAQCAMRERIADPIGLDVHRAAEGILRIAVTSMSYAVKAVTTERGLNVGGFTMVVYGGAGPLHASAIAREIGIRRVLIPYSPGYFSAYGMLFGDLRYDYVRSCFYNLGTVEFSEIEGFYASMEAAGSAAIEGSSIQPEQVVIQRAADMRYIGQEHAVTVELPEEVFSRRDREAIKRHFDAQHTIRYGTSAPSEPAELVSLRTTITGLTRKPPRHSVLEGQAEPEAAALVRRKPVFFGSAVVDTSVYRRDALRAGNRLCGPALIEERASTTIVAPGDALEVDVAGNLVIGIGEAAR